MAGRPRAVSQQEGSLHMFYSFQQPRHCSHLEKEAGDHCCGLVSIYTSGCCHQARVGLQQEQSRDSDGKHFTRCCRESGISPEKIRAL